MGLQFQKVNGKRNALCTHTLVYTSCLVTEKIPDNGSLSKEGSVLAQSEYVHRAGEGRAAPSVAVEQE